MTTPTPGPEYISWLPRNHANLGRDLKDALRYLAEAILDGDQDQADTWTAIAGRSARDLLRLTAQLAMLDVQASRLLEQFGHDGGVSSS
jgi:hypothetical protein